MENKINRIIDIIRSLKEEGAIANAVGNGGLTNASTPLGRLDGYDKFLGDGKMQRRGIIGKRKFPGARERWKPNPPQP
jgi:hypothetical protein